MASIDPTSIRPPAFADDQWYPARSADLADTIDGLLQAAPAETLPRPIGLIVPHAGLRFSGTIAASAYRQVTGHEYDLVIIISPLHRVPARGVATSTYRAYGTPLDAVPVDKVTLQQLGRLLPLTPVRQDMEHSLEIQLPFLQRALPPLPILPLMMGDQSLAAAQALARALAEVLRDRQPLVVASTDLSHFHAYEVAQQLDGGIVDAVERYDVETLADRLRTGESEACGGGPMLTTLLTCRALGASAAHVTAYANSGDVWPDRRSVVGYLAAILYGDA